MKNTYSNRSNGSNDSNRLGNLKKMNLISALASGLIGLAVGVLLLCISTEKLFSVLAVLLGVVGLIAAVPAFLEALSRNGQPGSSSDIILQGLILLISLALILSRNFVVMILVGLLLVIVPIVRISRASDSAAQFKQELPRLIVGVVLILVGPCRVVDSLFSVVGWGIILLSVIDLIFNLVTYSKKYSKAESVTKGTRTFVDVTGDGKIDTVYVDTTGDGKTDTEIPYDQNQKKRK